MGIHVGPPKLSLCTKIEINPVGVRVTALKTSKTYLKVPRDDTCKDLYERLTLALSNNS